MRLDDLVRSRVQALLRQWEAEHGRGWQMRFAEQVWGKQNAEKKQPHVSQWARGPKSPDIGSLATIASALKIQWRYFFDPSIPEPADWRQYKRGLELGERAIATAVTPGKVRAVIEFLGTPTAQRSRWLDLEALFARLEPLSEEQAREALAEVARKDEARRAAELAEKTGFDLPEPAHERARRTKRSEPNEIP